MKSNHLAKIDRPVRHKFLSLFRSHGLKSQEVQEPHCLSHSEDKSSNPLTPNETELRVLEPTSSAIPRPVPGSNTIHILCVVSGTLHLISSANARTKVPPGSRSKYPPARYDRDSLPHTITTTACYVTSLAVQWTRRRQSSSDDPEPSSTSLSEAETGDENGRRW